MDSLPTPYRLLWRRTWGDQKPDFVHTEGKAFARSYFCAHVPNAARWFWTVSDQVRHIASGYEKSPKAALLKCEALWIERGLALPTALPRDAGAGESDAG